MDSGKKNYFRHSMNARNDHKLRAFMDLFGRNWREGYFYFFTLLELCGNDARDGKVEHTFHKKTLRELWGTSAQGVHDVCTKCAQSALVMCIVGTDHVTFSIPNLLNYTGQYVPRAPNKLNQIKSNQSKENGEAVNPEPKKILPEVETQENPKNVVTGFFEPDDKQELDEVPADELPIKILTALNMICFRNFRPVKSNMSFINARLKEGYAYEDFVAVIKHRQELWGNEPKMSEYLRPKTLFNGDNFDGYVQAAAQAPKLQEIEDDRLIREAFGGLA